MSSPRGKKQKMSSEKPVAIDIDALLLRIIGSPSLSFKERIELRKVNKQLKRLVAEYYQRPENYRQVSYTDLLVLRKLYPNRADIPRLINEINATVDEFMGEETGRISVLTRKLRSGEFNAAIAERLRQKIQEYFNDRTNYYFPENQLGISAESQREYADVQKKITMLDKYLNKTEYSSKRTSSLGKYRGEDEFIFE